MEPKKLLSADYLDIIFDNRNKSYGGYELRRNYNRRMKKAGGIIALCMAAITSFSFITARNGDKPLKPYIQPVVITEVMVPQLPPPIIPRILPPPPAAPAPVKTVVFTPPDIIPDKEVTPEKEMSENKALKDADPGTANKDGDVDGASASKGKEIGTGVVDIPSNIPAPPVRWVEQMPQFPGEMNAYISKHLNYPEAARDAGIAGKVIIEFVVNEDGAVSDARILRSIGGGCDEEALRMIRNMPKWKPGKQNGHPVKVLFTLPISFVLN